MNILVLTGSPHVAGTSALLADSFIRGAAEAGHKVHRFDAAFQTVNPCRACDACAKTGVCVLRDDFSTLRPHLLVADLVVFVTPVYYFGMSAQLKGVIDRFYSVNSSLLGNPKQAVLLTTCADGDAPATHALETHYKAICDYLGWQNRGCVLARGVSARADIETTDFPRKAYDLALSLK